MRVVDPAAFYTGLVADLYAPLRGSTTDPEPYARFIELSGAPVLELGCGDGDPMLELRRRGLDVEGVDSSADMLDRLRRRAAVAGLAVVVHHQRMEALDLGGRRFRTIFLAGPTFNLLPDDDTAAAALVGIRRHLEVGGGALVPLFVPEPVPESALGRYREAVDDDGSAIRFCVVSVERDEGRRVQTSVLRYERVGDEALERPWAIHWYEREAFRRLAADAGLTTVAVLGTDGAEAADDATEVVFWLAAGS